MAIRRVLFYGFGWLGAAALAVLLAWQGVARVGTGITDRAPRPLSAEDARAALGAVPGAPAAGVPGPAPAAEPSPGPAPGGDNSGVATATTTTRPRPAVTPPSTRPPVSTPPSTRPAAPAPSSPAAPAAGSVVRTYNLVGGSATLRFDPSGTVTVVWADPSPGYRVEVDNRSDGGVRIRFDGSSHRSEVEAWWDNGPQDRVDESGSGGGGSGSH